MPTASQFSSQLSYVAEATPGTTPATPSMLKLRTTDPLSIEAGKESFQSEEIIGHRQVEDMRHGRESISGSIPIQLSYGAFDDWLEALLGGTWSAETVGTPEILKVGSNVQTFTVEQGFSDLPQYQVMRGVNPGSFSLDANPGGIITASFDTLGMSFDAHSGTSLGSASDVATNAPFDGLANAAITEGGSAIAIITALSLQVNNNRQVRGLVGSGGSSSPTNGQVEITGEFSARFQDASLLNKFKNETESALTVQFDDLGGSEYLKFTLPRIKYTGGAKSEAENDVDVTMPFTALYNASDASSIIIERSNA